MSFWQIIDGPSHWSFCVFKIKIKFPLILWLYNYHPDIPLEGNWCFSNLTFKLVISNFHHEVIIGMSLVFWLFKLTEAFWQITKEPSHWTFGVFSHFKSLGHQFWFQVHFYQIHKTYNNMIKRTRSLVILFLLNSL